MEDWSPLHAFYSAPARWAHSSWLEDYPDHLLQRVAGCKVCWRMLSIELIHRHPPPPLSDPDVPRELTWALADGTKLRELAVSTGTLLFSPWIKTVIQKKQLSMVQQALGPERLAWAIRGAPDFPWHGDVVEHLTRLNQAQEIQAFFVDAGGWCLHRLLQERCAPLAWRFRLLGKKPSENPSAPWRISCDNDLLLEHLHDLPGWGSVN